MKISVVIITHNRLEDLKRTIEGFLRQTYPNKEIIIVDNASADGTREMMASQYPDIQYLWLPDNFDIRSINIGVEMSKGDIIWRTDDDSFPESDKAFEKVIEIFENNPDIDIIAAEDIEVSLNYKIWEWYPLPVDKNNIPANGYKSNTFAGSGAAIRRIVFDKIGGFWEFGFEEIEFSTRAIIAGFNIRFFPNVRVLHYATLTSRNFANRWIKLSKQFMRYQWKFFPFSMALGRGIQIYFYQFIQAVISRLPISAIFEGMFGMVEVAFAAYRNERIVVDRNKIEDITLGVSLFKTQMRHYKHKVISRLNKWKRK